MEAGTAGLPDAVERYLRPAPLDRGDAAHSWAMSTGSDPRNSTRRRFQVVQGAHAVADVAS